MWCISHFWSFIDTFPWSSLLFDALWLIFQWFSLVLSDLWSFIGFHWSSLTFYWSSIDFNWSSLIFHCSFTDLLWSFLDRSLIFLDIFFCNWSYWSFIDLTWFSLIFHRFELIFIVCQQLTCTAWNHCCAAPRVTWKAAQKLWNALNMGGMGGSWLQCWGR